MAGSSQRNVDSRDCASLRVRFGLRSLLGLPVLMALGLGTLPARALPAASVQLFRINGNGVKTMPAISDALDRAQLQQTTLAQASQPAKPVVELVAQSDPAALGSLSSYSQSFVGALPANLSGNLRIVYIDPNTGTIGQVLEEIDVNGPNVTISPDRLKITIRLQPTSTIQPGQTVMLQLPSTNLAGDPIIYPYHLASTPCQFTVTAVSTLPVVPVPAAPLAAAAAPGFPIWAVVLGALVVGGVVTAIVTSSGSQGGGGTNNSSQ